MTGGCVAGGRALQEKRLLQRAVRILLECILVKLSFFSRRHAWRRGGGDLWRGMCYRGACIAMWLGGRYASYCNAF